MAARIERQQLAVDRRTFVATTRTTAHLVNGTALAAELRTAALEAIANLPAHIAHAVGEALIAKAEPRGRAAEALHVALQARLARTSAATQAAVEAGAIDLTITAKPAVPRRGGRSRAQLMVLVKVAAGGIVFDDRAGLAFIPGAGPVNLSVARALAARGDIAPSRSNAPEDHLMWRITDAGTTAMAHALEALASGDI